MTADQKDQQPMNKDQKKTWIIDEIHTMINKFLEEHPDGQFSLDFSLYHDRITEDGDLVNEWFTGFNFGPEDLES
ncbi:MAG: hypothetical protein LC687_02070 [Actinobacteria bacterium]|nr:hypothetical protein [Actinomycetota bacterium]